VRRGRRLEYFTIAWNSLEGLVAILSGLIAGGIALVGFGLDSLIEVTSGAALLWRLSLFYEQMKYLIAPVRRNQSNTTPSTFPYRPAAANQYFIPLFCGAGNFF